MSAFRWLELGQIDKGIKPIPKIDEKKRKILEDLKKFQSEGEKKTRESEADDEESVEEEDENEEETNNEKEEKFEETKEYLEYKEEEENRLFEEKYKLYLSVFTDDNVRLVEDSQETLDESDNDLSKNLGGDKLIFVG